MVQQAKPKDQEAKMVEILLSIQDLFMKSCSEKEGPLAGKITSDQLSPILEKCG
jgi:hypothetical protein